jgi:hypothetical protein
MPENLIGVWSLTWVGADASWPKAVDATIVLINKPSIENKKKGLKKFVFIIRAEGGKLRVKKNRGA